MDVSKKLKIFTEFYQKSKEVFEKLMSEDKSAQIYSAIYTFNVWPGGSDGGDKEEIVEVSWGGRCYGKKSNDDTNKTTLLMDYGAKLCYSRADNGNVIVLLYPAKFVNMKLKVDSIIIDYITNPKKLLKSKILRRHFKLLKAYMDITSWILHHYVI